MPASSGSMLSKKLQQGSLINASKPIGVLNRPTGSGEIAGKRDPINALICT